LGGTTNLQAGVTTTNDYGDYNRIIYQWQQYNGSSWTNILGANSSSYTTAPITSSGQSRQYRVVVYIPGANATSGVATVSGPGVPSISQDGGVTTLRWTGGGILQEAPEVDGPWTDAADQSNPQVVPTPAGTRKFFKLR
jgi:hypothetical protein